VVGIEEEACELADAAPRQNTSSGGAVGMLLVGVAGCSVVATAAEGPRADVTMADASATSVGGEARSAAMAGLLWCVAIASGVCPLALSTVLSAPAWGA
jgi:hypothetical protein